MDSLLSVLPDVFFPIAVPKGHLSSKASCCATASFTYGQLVMPPSILCSVADQLRLVFSDLECNAEGTSTLSNIGVGIGGTESTWVLIDVLHTVMYTLKIQFPYTDIGVNVGWFARNRAIIDLRYLLKSSNMYL
jgi:hypothetical protein